MFKAHMNCNKGYSLVELMVVVSIIGILSTVAIPAYQGYAAKARQKEGFVLLNTYYNAAQTARAEFNIYPGNFVGTGFAPVGTLSYRVIARNNATPSGLGWDDPLCITTSRACACSAPACPSFKTWTEAAQGSSSSIGPAGLGGGGACGAVAAIGVSDSTFSIRASAFIRIGAGRDKYAINHQKVMAMCEDGLN